MASIPLAHSPINSKSASSAKRSRIRLRESRSSSTISVRVFSGIFCIAASSVITVQGERYDDPGDKSSGIWRLELQGLPHAIQPFQAAFGAGQTDTLLETQYPRRRKPHAVVGNFEQQIASALLGGNRNLAVFHFVRDAVADGVFD